MATNLKNTTTMVKRGIIYFIVFVVVVLIIDSLVTPAPCVGPDCPTITPINSDYPTANELYGPIQKPEIDSIDATTGSAGRFSKKVTSFPTFPPVIYVYQINEERETFDDATIGKETALKLGFVGDYTSLNNVMSWDEGNKVFTFDWFQKLYKYIYKDAQLPAITNTDPSKAIEKGLSLFQYLGIDTNDIDAGSSYAYFTSRSVDEKLTTKTENYNSVMLALNKNIVGIRAKKTNIETTDITVRKYQYYEGIATLVLREYATKSQDQLEDLLELEYKALAYKENPAIYDLLTVEDAYKQVQLNKGYLYRLHPQGENYLGEQNKYEVLEYKVDPALTKLIYIEPEHRDPNVGWSIYLQPFYLFEGTAYTSNDIELEFSFILPALSKDSYKTL